MTAIKHLALTTDHIRPLFQHLPPEDSNLSRLQTHLIDYIERAEIVTMAHQERVWTLKNRNGPLGR